MRLLLDTHTFLWFILDDPQLSIKADALISDPNNQVEISPASYWEIAIKVSIGKYSLPDPYEPTFRRSRRAFPAGFGEPGDEVGRRPEAARGATD